MERKEKNKSDFFYVLEAASFKKKKKYTRGKNVYIF